MPLSNAIKPNPNPRSGKIVNLAGRTYAELDAWYRRQGSSLFQRCVELFGSSAERYQLTLLALAAQGAPKPSQKALDSNERQLANALRRYTAPTSQYYDVGFTTKISTAAPKWLEDSVAVKRQQLLKLAGRRAQRPRSRTQLGQVLCRYASPTSQYYDVGFATQIRECAPEWLEDSVAVNKQQLLKFAGRNAKRPPQGTRLGNGLRNYTHEKSRTYDPVFAEQIRERAPHWFDTTIGKKQQLLKLAGRGAKRLSYTTQLGNALSHYCNKGKKRYDPVFDKEIRKRAPHWFQYSKTAAARKKQRLLTRAQLGKSRPSNTAKNLKERQLGYALSRYTNKNKTGYDPAFDEQIRKYAPKWFKDRWNT